MRNCWYCGGELIWQSDYSLEDLYGEGDGIATVLECSVCHAHVEYTLNNEREED